MDGIKWLDTQIALASAKSGERFTRESMARLAGFDSSSISHVAAGRKRPGKKFILNITNGLKTLGVEISAQAVAAKFNYFA